MFPRQRTLLNEGWSGYLDRFVVFTQRIRYTSLSGFYHLVVCLAPPSLSMNRFQKQILRLYP